MKNDDLIIIGGPTASGKTSLALEIAKIAPVEIISSDSRQVFKFMDIGTAKPSKEELEICPHHFIDIIEPKEYFSAGVFGEQAREKVKEIKQRDNIPLVVGGSGLYIQALTEGFFEENYHDAQKREVIKKKLNEEYNKYGTEYLYKKLQEIDPEAAWIYIQRNHRRLIRALEHIELTGEKFSAALERSKLKRIPYKCYALDHPRDVLYEIINKRTEQMWDAGLITETEYLLNKYSKNINSLQTVGYKEVIAYLEGELDRVEAVEKMKQNTRRYAKRQTTWFKNSLKTEWLEFTNIKDIANKITETHFDKN